MRYFDVMDRESIGGGEQALFEQLAAEVEAWRLGGYPCLDYPEISQLLKWQRDDSTGQSRFLRQAQIRALETYWYLRVIRGTPRILDLYKELFPRTSEMLPALGLDHPEILACLLDLNGDLDALAARVMEDDDFVGQYSLEALRESLTLDYPSYVFALAMGAGKTVFIASVIATEFSMAISYPDGPFVKNALVFAPGKTILGALREIADCPYDRMLPTAEFRRFSATVKLTFTRDGEMDVPVVPGSLFNVVVTNTEKIRIRSESQVAGGALGRLFDPSGREKRDIVNRRLQTIASLPHLAVFSDEAHHTYGQALGAELKKVRQTVDYLARTTNLLCVINTSGTPYYQRQPLRDVVAWYGLSEGIRDGILKDLSGNIKSYDFADDAVRYVQHVVGDFFKEYGDVRLPGGSRAKLAMYFPNTAELSRLRPYIESTVLALGEDPTLLIVNTSSTAITTAADLAAFQRLNDPASPNRVVLLVNKGSEGWNCPSLFACALVRKLKDSNNFVLQAATRCLRQVPGNTHKAKVYLSSENMPILERQLEETYGESIRDLEHAATTSRSARIVIRKPTIQPLVFTRLKTTVRRVDTHASAIELMLPDADPEVLTVRSFGLSTTEGGRVLLADAATTLAGQCPEVSTYLVAVRLASTYRRPMWEVLDALRAAGAGTTMSPNQIDSMAEQLELQLAECEVVQEQTRDEIDLIRLDGFDEELLADGSTQYSASISYPVAREDLILPWSPTGRKPTLGFHYSPYNFDSAPEMSLFDQLLDRLDFEGDEVQDIYFTGGLTSTDKTDFFIEYVDAAGARRRYTPDFLVRFRTPTQTADDSRAVIVEVKSEGKRLDPDDGLDGTKATAARALVALNPERLRYTMVFARTSVVAADAVDGVIETAASMEESNA